MRRCGIPCLFVQIKRLPMLSSSKSLIAAGDGQHAPGRPMPRAAKTVHLAQIESVERLLGIFRHHFAIVHDIDIQAFAFAVFDIHRGDFALGTKFLSSYTHNSKRLDGRLHMPYPLINKNKSGDKKSHSGQPSGRVAKTDGHVAKGGDGKQADRRASYHLRHTR